MTKTARNKTKYRKLRTISYTSVEKQDDCYLKFVHYLFLNAVKTNLQSRTKVLGTNVTKSSY